MTVPDVDPGAAHRVVFFTGAGLSAECGLPTYRGAGGIWHEYDYREYACQRAFDRSPEKVWDFHDERRRVMGAAAPGDAHRRIARLQEALASTIVITQNIDGLHQRAGSRHVIELHGSIWRTRCGCRDGSREDHETPLADRRCPTCAEWRRPDIVWFGDSLDATVLAAAAEALETCDLLVSIGTSGSVYPAAELPRLASARGTPCIEVNPEETPVSHWYDVHLRGGASEMLRRLWPDT
jgi:NAD-dependent deacetylase